MPNRTSIPVLENHAYRWSINLTEGAVEEMHPDRLQQLFAGLRMISIAVADYTEPTETGKALRVFEKRVRDAQ